MNIVLIGMSGVGKTFFGQKIAEKLNLKFLDTDEILRGTSVSIQILLDEIGEVKFLKKEEKVIVSLLDIRNTIISTGGSVIYSDMAMNHLKKIGKVIWLNDSFENLILRNNIEHRGIIGMKNKTYKGLFEERSILYEKFANIIIDNPSEEKILKECLKISELYKLNILKI